MEPTFFPSNALQMSFYLLHRIFLAFPPVPRQYFTGPPLHFYRDNKGEKSVLGRLVVCSDISPQ